MHYRHEVTGRCIPRTSSDIPSLTCNTAHAESAQTNCTQLQQTSQPTILYPEATNTANIKQQNDGPPSKRTRSKYPLNASTQSQPFRHTHHSGAHLTQQLSLTAPLATQPTHIDTQSMHKKAQQYEGPPSKRTRSRCPDHKALHQTPVILTTQHLPLSAPADLPTLSCNLQSNPRQQKRRKFLQLNTKLECPGPCMRPLDPASTANAIWNYKINKARSLNASNAVNTFYFYDLEVTSIDN